MGASILPSVGISDGSLRSTPPPRKVLATRFPTVPNLGDLTACDWSTVPPVDVVTAGYPLLPTPTTSAGTGAGEHGQGGANLQTVLLPTPTANTGRNATAGRQSDSQHHSGTTLHDVAYQLLQTPTTRDHKGRNQRDDTTCLPGAISAATSPPFDGGKP